VTTRDFAFVQTAPGRVFVGWGPFEQLPFRRPDRPAFFITDFFLDDPRPWRHPESWSELSVAELAAEATTGSADATRLEVHWQPPSLADFAPIFDSAKSAMHRGDFKKIVPVLFERGRFATTGVDVWPHLLARLAHVPPGMWAYGYSYQRHGLIGITPEVLFRGSERGYSTMALAGTRPAAQAKELLTDPKELLEHRLVVDDISRRLAPFGNLEIGDLGILELPTIAHLATPIAFEESGGSEHKMSFADMVRRLHPTAALGVSPRTQAGERWLREADRGVKRRTFGAPFGLERPDRFALALVAIRNVQWGGDEVRIGSGAGMLPESRIDREFDELRQKRAQVKSLFGLTVDIEAHVEH
jgi:menaquinone-specific isochorismate synthase